MRDSLSAIILTRNEARHLPDCLATLRWSDEVLVLDSGSTDQTRAIARAAGARVEERPFTHFGDQREAALRLARHPWVLFVDADERVPPALAADIQSTLSAERAEVGWWIPRRNFFWGREVRYSGWAPDYQLRLMRRDAAHFDPTQIVHEVAYLDGASGYLREPLLHINYDSWGEFWRKQAAYTQQEAEKLAARGQRFKPRNLILQPPRAFYRRYVTWRGWRDGLLGLQLALVMAWWEWMMYRELSRLGATNNEARP